MPAVRSTPNPSLAVLAVSFRHQPAQIATAANKFTAACHHVVTSSLNLEPAHSVIVGVFVPSPQVAPGQYTHTHTNKAHRASRAARTVWERPDCNSTRPVPAAQRSSALLPECPSERRCNIQLPRDATCITLASTEAVG